MKRSERIWIVVSKRGAYTGARFTRVDMIASHVSDYAGVQGFPTEISPYGMGRKLDASQSAAWAICKKRGDRCVHATVTWAEP